MDGLQYTKQWITRSADKLQYPETPDGGATAALPQPTPVVILTTAYMELLEWDENQTFPEVQHHFTTYIQYANIPGLPFFKTW